MTLAFRPNVTRAAEGLPRRRFTIAEVEAMVAAGLLADERNELIGGELVPMSPKGSRHEILKVVILDRWYRARPDTCMLAPETTFRLSEDTLSRARWPESPRARSATDVFLVVEISDSSLAYDLGRKPELYAGFGVREPLFAPAPFALRLRDLDLEWAARTCPARGNEPARVRGRQKVSRSKSRMAICSV